MTYIVGAIVTIAWGGLIWYGVYWHREAARWKRIADDYRCASEEWRRRARLWPGQENEKHGPTI